MDYRRIQGIIKQVSFERPVFAIVLGDDGKDYFLIPSLMRPNPGIVVSTISKKQAYYSLSEGVRVEFDPTPTVNGLLAHDVILLCLSSSERGRHGEASQQG